MRRTVDVCVAGAGPAGLAAAAAAPAAGAGSVLVVDREPAPGGILLQCVHDGFGLEEHGESLTGPEYAGRAVEEARRAGAGFAQDASVLRISPGPEVTLVGSEGCLTLRAGAVVVATGCRERTRGNVLVPGSRPAGVFTAGTVQRLVNVLGVLPGRRAVVLGSGDVGLIVARRLHLEGCEVEGVYEILPRPGGLPRNVVQCLQDHGIPLHVGHTVTRIHGRRRVEAVTVAAVDSLPGSERLVPCDTLVTSLGLIPEIEILRDLDAGEVDEGMRTAADGILRCGNAAFVHDTVDCVTACGRVAGAAAARRAAGERWPRRLVRVLPGEGVRQVVPGALSEDARTARFHLRVTVEGFGAAVEARVASKALARWRVFAVAPPQAVVLDATPRQVEDILEAGGDIYFSVRLARGSGHG